MVDVFVRFEQEESLVEAAVEKSRKYQEILQSVMRDMGVLTAEVMPLVFGSRGEFPSATAKNLSKLGLTTRKDLCEIMKGVLRSSVSIGRAHIE